MKHALMIALCCVVPCLACSCDAGKGGLTSPAEPTSFSLFDGAHQGGNPHFFFLPPMVSAPSPIGVFDATLAPVVQICAWTSAGCAMPLVATFTTDSGPGSQTVRVVPQDELYIVDWHLADFDLDTTATYRISVFVSGVELGHADVDVVANGSQLKNVDTDQLIPLLDGRTLPIKFRIEQGALGASSTVQPEGGAVTLPGVGAITFPAGTVPAATSVTLLTTPAPVTPEGRTLWDVSLGPPSIQLPYDIRINSGAVAPAAAFEATLVVPDEFLRSMPPGHVPQIFALLVEGNDNENMEIYRRLDSDWDPSTGKVHAEIPLVALGTRVDDGTTEIVLSIGSTGGSVSAEPPSPDLAAATLAGTCTLNKLSPPIAGPLTLTGAFGPDHRGADYRADGDSVFFTGDSGTLRTSGYQDDPLRRNPRRERLGLTRTGAGRYVTITNADGSITKYFHLDSASVVTQNTYVRGDFIGLADATPPGGVSLTRFRGRLTRSKFGAEVAHEIQGRSRTA